MKTLNVDTTIRGALAVGLCAMATAGAHTDCGPVIAAYQKAQATKRFAMYNAKGMADAPKGKPFHVSIDDKSVTDAGTGYIDSGSGTATAEADMLARGVKEGKKRCDSLGDSKVGDEAVTGYSIRNDDKGNDYTAIHFWISKSTGLPMYHGMGAGAGLRWVYGPGVVMPTTVASSRQMPEPRGIEGKSHEWVGSSLRAPPVSPVSFSVGPAECRAAPLCW